MLPSALLRVRSMQTGVLLASYLDTGKEGLQEGAAQLLELVRSHLGVRRGDLDESLSQLERVAKDRKLLAGLVDLLLHACRFESSVDVSPTQLRTQLFEAAAKVFPVGTTPDDPKRQAILEAVASHHNLTVEEVEQAMFADLGDEQRLVALPDWTPLQLLQRYNVGLAQGILLNGQYLEILLIRPTPARIRQLIRYLKFFRLLFQIEPHADGVLIVVDGPLSVLEQTRAYGVRFANFLPALLHLPDFALKARIKWRGKWTEFRLRSQDGLVSYYPDKGAWVPAELQAFADSLAAKLDGVATVEMAESLVSLGGKDAFVPDLEVRCGQNTYPIEIVWPWQRLGDEHWLKQFSAFAPKEALVLVSKKALNPKLADRIVERTRDPRIQFYRVTPPSDKVAAWIMGSE